MKIRYVVGLIKALLGKLAVASNQGAANAGKVLGVDTDGSVITVPTGEAGVTDAGDVAYVSGSGYTSGSAGAAMETMEGDVSQLKSGITQLDGDVGDLQSAVSMLEAGSLSALSANLGDVPIANGDGTWAWESNGYVTPEMFGAKGDGITDDTQSVTNALKYSIENKIPLLLVKKYSVTGTLLSSAYASSVTLDIKGNRPYRYSTRHANDGNSNGSLIVSEGVNLFDSLTVYGSIETIGVLTNVQSEAQAYSTGSLFYNCDLYGFSLVGCCVSRIGSVFFNTSLYGCSLIKDNICLNINCFAKCTKECSFVDSVIEGCYINGGRLTGTDHDCFNWWQWNGSVVRNNFIDYYRCIYNPYRVASASAYLPLSTGNEYQVFVYLYNAFFFIGSTPNSEPYLRVHFSNDVINWTDPNNASTPELAAYAKFTYTGHDGETYTVPECVMWIHSRESLIFDNIKIEGHIGNLCFIVTTPASYPTSILKTDVCGNFSIFDNKVKTIEGGYYIGGSYQFNVIDLPFVTQIDALPSAATVWDVNNNYVGRKVLLNEKPYRLLYNYSTSAREWVQMKYNFTN